jgi:hypothetical protein
MAHEKIKLLAKAKSLGVANYRTLTTAELEEAISNAEGTQSDNGASTSKKSATKTAGKTARKSASKKSAKSAPAKSASTGAQAKRQTTGGSKRKSSAKSSTSKKSTTARKPAAASTNGVGRMNIDNGAIDWQAEWGGGKSGNRKLVMDALRRFKGNTDKVFDKLRDKAPTMYAKDNNGRKRSAEDARRLLSWHISRVKFDFVTQTGQHQGVVRSKSGPNAATQTPARKQTTAKPTRKPAARKGGAQRRKTASTARKRTTRKRTTKR